MEKVTRIEEASMLHKIDTVIVGGGQAGLAICGCPEQNTAETILTATGQSKISVQDYAVAMIDELERPTHVRQRFTVGY
jgi:anaerobic glycerol-3-phosphate dehydrogenase